MDHVAWQCAPVNNACRLGAFRGYERTYELTQGRPLAKVWPKDVRAGMDRDFKKATGLTDDLMNMDSVKVCSGRLVELLEKSGVKHVEYLPLTILDHKGKVASTDYFILNPVGLVDALDRKASEPDYNLIDKELINWVARTVLDPRRLDPERKVFRLAGLRLPVLVERPLAEAMKGAGMVGPYFRELASLTR